MPGDVSILKVSFTLQNCALFEITSLKFECFNADPNFIANYSCQAIDNQRLSWSFEYVPGSMKNIWLHTRIFFRKLSSESYKPTPINIKIDLCDLSKSKSELVKKVSQMTHKYDASLKDGCPIKVCLIFDGAGRSLSHNKFIKTKMYFINRVQTKVA